MAIRSELRLKNERQFLAVLPTAVELTTVLTSTGKTCDVAIDYSLPQESSVYFEVSGHKVKRVRRSVTVTKESVAVTDSLRLVAGEGQVLTVVTLLQIITDSRGAETRNTVALRLAGDPTIDVP